MHSGNIVESLDFAYIRFHSPEFEGLGDIGDFIRCNILDNGDPDYYQVEYSMIRKSDTIYPNDCEPFTFFEGDDLLIEEYEELSASDDLRMELAGRMEIPPEDLYEWKCDSIVSQMYDYWQTQNNVMDFEQIIGTMDGGRWASESAELREYAEANGWGFRYWNSF